MIKIKFSFGLFTLNNFFKNKLLNPIKSLVQIINSTGYDTTSMAFFMHFPHDFLSPLQRKTCQSSHMQNLYGHLKKQTSRLESSQTTFPLRKRLVTYTIHEFFVDPYKRFVFLRKSFTSIPFIKKTR